MPEREEAAPIRSATSPPAPSYIRTFKHVRPRPAETIRLSPVHPSSRVTPRHMITVANHGARRKIRTVARVVTPCVVNAAILRTQRAYSHGEIVLIAESLDARQE
ncbi:hypothetical protein NPIL_496911 [Nephila pilipes]|uniref:Uncharacterized protein n=1 Tax=Nephila pilipes TaxID=299642 RepID=A0A8X6NNW8_NEPPI|nr:hypothetical protein NPIL_496911 [Nephila pilipes]